MTGGRQAVRRLPLRGGDGERPERGVVAAPELAGDAAHRPRVHERVARDPIARRQLSLLGVELELDQRHGGQRPDVMRIDDVEEGLGDLREIVVDLEMDARGEKREPLEQPLDVGILALVGLELEARRHLGIPPGELRAHAPEKRQLALVVVQQIVTHRRLP